MRIKILGDSDQTRGKVFELLMVSILSHLGYTDFKIRVRPAAMELDIEATHKSNNNKILCECKAHKEPISPDDVKLFHSKLYYEIDKNHVDKGLFFSISGFTSNVDRWYKDSGENTKRTLSLNGIEPIVQLLHESTLLTSDEILDRIVKNNTSYQLGERYLVAYQSDLFVIQLLVGEGRITSYMILKGTGNIVPVPVMDEISKLDYELADYSRLNPIITKKVTFNLLDLKQKSLETIAVEIGETAEDAKVAVGDLQLQQIVLLCRDNNTISQNLFSINVDLSTLITLTQRFALDDKRFDFMSSLYIDSVVNDNFADLVIDRFKVLIIDNIKIALIRSARIFPSVLHFLLLGDTSSYQYFHRSFQKFNERPEKQDLKNIVSSMFFNQIYQDILYDLRTASTSYLSKKNVLGYMHRFEIKLGSESDLILAIHGKMHTYIANKKIGQEIRSGEIVNPVDIGSNIQHGNHLLSIGEYRLAIDIFDIVIKNSKDPELISIAWNNKAQCFRMLRQHRRELQYINKALKYKKVSEYFSNKILCLETLGRKDEAEVVRKQLVELQSRG